MKTSSCHLSAAIAAFGLLFGCASDASEPGEEASVVLQSEQELAIAVPKVPIRPQPIFPVPVPRLPTPTLPNPTPAPAAPAVRAPDCSPRTFLWSGPIGMVSCPPVPATQAGTFNGEPVFYAAGGIPELARHCAYTWLPNQQAPADIAHLTTVLSQYGGQEPPAPDCPVIEPLGGSTELTERLWSQLMQQTSPAPLGLPKQGAVTVAVLDTAAIPFSSIDPARQDTFAHGRLMGNIVHALSCPPESTYCPITIDNTLALAFVDIWTRNVERGGYFGSRLDLARAIHIAGLKWGYYALVNKHVPPLVLNLSLGWEALHDGGSGENVPMTVPARIVYTALERASCLGAATVVAAGNAAGDMQEGFMLPALWRTHSAPNEKRCQQLTGIATDAPRSERPRKSHLGFGKLLEAVSSLDLYDDPLATARAQATPRLAAYGQTATTSDVRSDTGFTPVMSGSSVSAAVLSAALSSVWAVAPELSAAEALERVYDKAIPVGRTIEPCSGSSCADVRRVSVCDATYATACERFGCGGISRCETVDARHGKSTLADFEFIPGDYPRLPVRSCSSRTGCDASGPSYGYAPWVGSQPGNVGCPYCAVRVRSYSAFLTLPPDLQRSSGLQLQLSNGNHYLIEPTAAGYPARFSLEGLTTRGTTSARLVSTVGAGSTARTNATPITVY